MRLVPAVFLTAFAALAAHADTGAIRQTQLEFLEARSSASGGATAKRGPIIPDSDKEALFKSLDIDGDGAVSKAEAAGNAPVTLGFDRADRNKDGKLSWVEYDSIGKPPEKKAKTRQARNQGGAAAAGGTKATEKK